MPLDPSLDELAGQSQMTHWPEQPNPAAPYLQGARDIAGRALGFSGGGLTGAFPEMKQYMPRAINTPGEVFQSRPAQDALSVGGPALGIMGGTLGHWPQQALSDLALAKQMETKGMNQSQVRAASQWYKEHQTGIWNKEIFDREATLNRNEVPRTHGYLNIDSTVGKVLNHPDLYKAYPHIKDIPLIFANSPRALRDGDEAGYFPPTFMEPNGRVIVYNAHMRTVPQTRRAILHELQHAVDEYEGRRSESFPGIPFDQYWNLLEERRARNTEKRSDYTPEQLKQEAMDPWRTMDPLRRTVP